MTEQQILQWAAQRGLLTQANPIAQAAKTIEEASELLTATVKSDLTGVIDGIGDVWVTLVILAAQHGLDMAQCQAHAWDQIKDRTGRTEHGLFIKESAP